MRIATDPSRNYIIVKCDEADLPEIQQLLRMLDDIPDVEIKVRIFQLKNLDAAETANNVKEVLGIEAARGGRQPARQAQRGGAAQQQLMQMLEQQMVSVSGGSGASAKIESTEIVPNEITNALLVSAPEEVMSIIEDVISDLEDLEARDVVVVVHRTLEQARVDDVLPLLQEIFTDAGGRKTASRSPSALGPVMITGDPRSNTIIFTAESKDVTTVEAQIDALDIEGMINEAETYVCQYGDAQSIADVATAIYGQQGAGRAAPRRGGGGAVGGSATSEVRIVAEPSTNAIVVWGPLDKREIILAKIRDFDEGARQAFRDIDLVYADAEELAEKLSQMFGGTTISTGGGNRRVRGGSRNTSGATGGGTVILGDENAQKLLVRASDPVFEQIEEMVALLDRPDEMLQIRRYTLEHADADTVKASLDGAIQEYGQMSQITGNMPSFDPFTVVPDARTNSIMVVGSEKTFLFVERVLASVDVATPSGLKTAFRVFELELADATIVADAINSMSVSAAGAQPQGRQGRGRRSTTPGGGTGAGELKVNAVPETTTNSVMVFGIAEDIDEVAETVIRPFEEMVATRMTPVTIPVHNAPPSQVASYIRQFIGTASAQEGGRGRDRRRDAGASEGPHLVPNDNAKTLVVSGTTAQVERIRSLVQQFDDPQILMDQIKIIPIPHGQDLVALAQQVEDLVNRGETIMATQQNRTANEVAVGYDEDAHALLVAGDPTLYGMVDTTVQQIIELAGRTEYKTIIWELENLTATDAIQMINELQEQSSGGGRSTPRRTPSRRPTGGSRRPRGSWVVPSQALPPVPGDLNVAPGQLFVGTTLLLPVFGAKFVDDVTGDLTDQARAGRLPRSAAKQAAPKATRNPTRPREDAGMLQRYGAARDSRRARRADQPTIGRSLMVAEDEAIARAPAHAPRLPAGRTWLEARRALAAELMPDVAPETTKEVTTPASTIEAPPSVIEIQPSVHVDAGTAKRVEREAEPAEEDEKEGAANEAPAPYLAQRQPADEQPKTPRVRRPRAARAVAEEPPVVPAETDAVEGVPDLSGVSGRLKGEVTATELDPHRLMVSGDAADLAFLEQLLRSMEAVARVSEIRVFKLDQAKANAIQKIVDETIKSLIQARGGDDTFSVTAEPRSNSLIVAAPTDILVEIEDIIRRIDVVGAGGENKVATIPLTHVRASEAKAQLTPVIERLNSIREVPKESQASLEAIDRSNSLLIIGTPTDIEEITELVVAIDVDLADEGERLGVYSEMLIVGLQNGQAEDIAKVLTDMIEAEQEAARKAAGAKEPGVPAVRKLSLTAPDGRELPPLDLEKPIRLIPEKGTNSIIVFSTKKNNEALTEMVEVFDTLPVGAETDVKAFALRYAMAEQVAEVLEKVFDDGKAALKRPSEGDGGGLEKGILPPVPPGLAAKGLPYQVSFSHDARSNTLFAIGRTDAVKLVNVLVTEMDRPSTDLGIDSHIIALRNVQSSTIEEQVTDLLEKRAETMGNTGTERDVAVVKADDRSNSLVVFANDDVYDMIEELVMKLDAADSYRIVTTEFRPLEYADAIKLQRLLEEVFDAKEDASQKTDTQANDTLSVIADGRSNSLVLTGTRDYLEEAKDLVTNLDQQFEPTVEFKVVKVRLNSSANVAARLNDMIDKTLSDQESNLTGAPIHIAADPISDSLLLAASREDMVMIERWIEILDKPSEIGRMTRILPLRQRSAEELADSLQDLFQNTGEDVDLTVTHEPTTNSIVAIGPPALLEDIEDIVRRFDDIDPQAVAVVKSFKLKQADAEDAGDLLMNILEGQGGAVGGGGRGGGGGSDTLRDVMLIFQTEHPDLGPQTFKAMRQNIVVTADLRTNSLMIVAPAESMPLMESLVAAIDIIPSDATIRVFPLRNSDAEQMVQMLEPLFEETSQGTGDDNEERQLTMGALGAGGRQQIRFNTDVRTNSVIAAGTPGYLDIAEELILSLDSKPIEERKTVVYAPRNTPVESLVASLVDYSDAEQTLLDELGDDISTQRRLEREIVAIAAEDSNRVIISFDPRRETEVFDIVNELDQPPPQVSIEVLIVEVTMENSLELGVEFAFQDLQFAAAGPSDTTTFDYVGGTDIGAVGTGLGGFSFTITGRDFNFLLRTLQTETGLNVLSRPHIVAMDGQAAKIEVVNDVPYVSGSSTSTVGGQITTSVARSDVGIKLNVTPQINPDGYVRLEITQEVSDLTDSTIEVGPGLTAPIFRESLAETVVTVRDNETVVLGGLIQERDERTESKVPVLGDVPVLGNLFRYDDTTTRKAELLIIMTPRIIRTVDDYREISVAARDATGTLPEHVLTNPLMNNLRVQPENLLPGEYDELGPFPKDDIQEIREEVGSEEYGPLGNLRSLRREIHTNDPADVSYDLPIARLGHDQP